jgi:hypothetical protein
VLQIQPKFSDVRPRLPNGGPDGGRDIEAIYNNDQRVFGAVGFVNNASDASEDRREVKSKFGKDLKKLNDAPPDESGRLPTVFVFFTNVGLTPKIIEEIKERAYGAGVTVCEVFDRERLRIALDSAAGYATRFRYLDIALSDAEQKDFFSRFGEEIQSLMASRLQKLDAYSKRLTFLMEAQLPVDNLAVGVKLDADLGDISGGDFVFQTSIMLRTHADGLIRMTLGACSEPIVESIDQIRATSPHLPCNGQIGFSFAHLLPGFPQYDAFAELHDTGTGDDKECRVRIVHSSGLSYLDRPYVWAKYCSEPFLMRWNPTCRLMDLHRASLLFDCNAELAPHIETITVSANQYTILEINAKDIQIVKGSFDRLLLPEEAHQTADSSQWVMLRPVDFVSCFTSDFMTETPRRWLSFDERVEAK